MVPDWLDEVLPRVGMCLACREAERRPDSKFCSEACGQLFLRSCTLCRAAPRAAGKYCSERCRGRSAELAGVPRAFMPACEEFRLTGGCAYGGSCWLRHPAAGPVGFQLLLQCQSSHAERFVEYLEARHRVEVVQQEKCPATDARQRSSQMNVFARVQPGTDPDRVLCDLVCDENLVRVYSRGYRVEGRAASEEELFAALSRDAPTRSSCRVQAFPRSLETAAVDKLNDGLLDGMQMHRREFSSLMCLFQDESGILYGWCRDVGEAAAAAICSGGGGNLVCRASCKLSEVLRRCSIARRGGVAVDVGASPGGWSAVLAERCDTVYAVDPAELATPRASNIVHLRSKAEDCLPGLLAGIEDLAFLVCDMNASPRNVLQLIIPLLQHLASDAVVVVTLKNFIGTQCKTTKGQAVWNGIVDDAVREFKRHLQDVEVIHLFSNGLQERTVIGFK